MNATPPDFRQLRFWSDEHPPAHRLTAWRAIVSRTLMTVEIEPLSREPFQVDATLRILPGIRFGSALFGPCVNRRTPEMVQADNDDFFFVINTEGSIRVLLGSVEHTLKEGDACVISARQEVTLTRAAVGRLTIARIERTTLSALVSGPDDHAGRIIRNGDEALRLLTVYLRDIDHRQTLASEDMRRLVIAHILDLIALVMSSCRNQELSAEGTSTQRLQRIKRYILDHLDNADLSIGDVAADNAISARQVQRMFELEDSTFSEFVLTNRLKNVRVALLDNRQAHRSVSQIALANGFGDVSYFNRAFRRRFGASPSGVRKFVPESV